MYRKAALSIHVEPSRTAGLRQRQVTPAIKEDIVAMVEGLAGIKGSRDRALLLIGFAGAFRRSELVPLTVADIELAQQGLIIQLRFSKTDQERRGREVKGCGALSRREEPAYPQWGVFRGTLVPLGGGRTQPR